jgi:hypothetical protein
MEIYSNIDNDFTNFIFIHIFILAQSRQDSGALIENILCGSVAWCGYFV